MYPKFCGGREKRGEMLTILRTKRVHEKTKRKAGLGNRCRVGTDMSQKLRCVLSKCFNIEKTRKKAGENTMKERLYTR